MPASQTLASKPRREQDAVRHNSQQGAPMTISRRDLLIGSAITVTAASTGARAQAPQEVVIGAIYPLSGASAQIGVDAQFAFNTAADIVNTSHDLDLPLARSAGLPGLNGAKIR